MLSCRSVDYTKPKTFRQHGLELYHFQCTCPRCADDLSVYQVCKTSPVLPLNSLSFVPDIQVLRDPDATTSLWDDANFRNRVDKIYAACTPEAAAARETGGAPDRARLQQQWAHCAPLVAARMWAVEPLANLLQQAINYYSRQSNFIHALVVECLVAVHSDPYKYPAPFRQWRLKGLLMIAKTLTNVAMPAAGGHPDVDPRALAIVEKTDEASLYEVIVLLVLRLGPLGHSDEWEILESAREMLKDVEGIKVQRQRESALIHSWLQNPEGATESMFFSQRCREPVLNLANLAPEILAAELQTGLQLTRK